jgi:SAM-dependent methyltransferase
MTLPDLHLDIGCGERPQNPYRRATLCGVDIRERAEVTDFDYRMANLSLAPIPYENSRFGSVSAFDFLEHVPRVLASSDGQATRFPFVELMNEVWRVLAPGGRFWALTPAFPNTAAFTDPTHVNTITDRTHEYFCGPSPLGRMYGFRGRFEVHKAEWVVDGPPARLASAWPLSFGQRFRRLRRRIKGQLVYVLWDLEAVKAE